MANVKQPDETTGTDVLRQVVRVRSRIPGASALIARDLGISVDALDGFGAGQNDLSVDVLQTLTKYAFPFSELDPAIDRLRSANRQEPKSLGAPPPPLDPATLPKWDREWRAGPQPLKPEPKRPLGPRPGWAD